MTRIRRVGVMDGQGQKGSDRHFGLRRGTEAFIECTYTAAR